MDNTMPDATPDVWTQMFEQTPPLLRFALGVLTLGLFTLAGMLWKWNRTDLQRVESQLHQRMDSVEQKMDKGFREVNGHLIRISNGQDR